MSTGKEVIKGGQVIGGDVTIVGNIDVTGTQTYTGNAAVTGTLAVTSTGASATATSDFVTVTNKKNASSMTGCGTGMLWNQWYYDGTTPAVADAARIAVITEQNWTSTAATQDSKLSFQTCLNGTVAEKVAISSDGVLTVTGLIAPTAASGAAQDRALLIGRGTAGDPATWATADKCAIEFRCKSTATTGTAYGLYMGMEGATAAEHIPVRGRVLTTAATGNAHGGHFTLESDGTNGKVTGLGTGCRMNWVLGGAAEEAGGTYYGAMAEIYATASGDPSAVTRYACLAVGVGGNATAAALCKNAIDFYSAGADATTNMIYSHDHSAGNAAGSIRILVNGVVRYLKFWAAE